MADEVLFPLQMYPLKTNVKGGLDMQYFIHESITIGDLHKAHAKTSLKGCGVYFRCDAHVDHRRETVRLGYTQ